MNTVEQDKKAFEKTVSEDEMTDEELMQKKFLRSAFSLQQEGKEGARVVEAEAAMRRLKAIRGGTPEAQEENSTEAKAIRKKTVVIIALGCLFLSWIYIFFLASLGNTGTIGTEDKENELYIH